MPLCGFNEKMLAGLSIFAEGLFDQALKRAKEDKVSLEQSLKQEIHEMNIFREILDSKGENELQVLRGITLLSQDLYRQSLASSASEIREKFFNAVQEEKEFCIELDNEYYDNLRPRFGPEEALHKLSPWLDRAKHHAREMQL